MRRVSWQGHDSAILDYSATAKLHCHHSSWFLLCQTSLCDLKNNHRVSVMLAFRNWCLERAEQATFCLSLSLVASVCNCGLLCGTTVLLLRSVWFLPWLCGLFWNCFLLFRILIFNFLLNVFNYDIICPLDDRGITELLWSCTVNLTRWNWSFSLFDYATNSSNIEENLKLWT